MCMFFTGKGIFNCERFLGLMALYHERTKNQDEELRAAFRVFDKEAKGYIEWDTLKYVSGRLRSHIV